MKKYKMLFAGESWLTHNMEVWTCYREFVIVRANSRGWSRPLRRIIPCKAPSRSSPAGGLWSGQCTGKLCRVRAIISRSFPFRKWIPLPLDSPPKVELSQVRGMDSPLWASSSSRLGR